MKRSSSPIKCCHLLLRPLREGLDDPSSSPMSLKVFPLKGGKEEIKQVQTKLIPIEPSEVEVKRGAKNVSESLYLRIQALLSRKILAFWVYTHALYLESTKMKVNLGIVMGTWTLIKVKKTMLLSRNKKARLKRWWWQSKHCIETLNYLDNLNNYSLKPLRFWLGPKIWGQSTSIQETCKNKR